MSDIPIIIQRNRGIRRQTELTEIGGMGAAIRKGSPIPVGGHVPPSAGRVLPDKNGRKGKFGSRSHAEKYPCNGDPQASPPDAHSVMESIHSTNNTHLSLDRQ